MHSAYVNTNHTTILDLDADKRPCCQANECVAINNIGVCVCAPTWGSGGAPVSSMYPALLCWLFGVVPVYVDLFFVMDLSWAPALELLSRDDPGDKLHQNFALR